MQKDPPLAYKKWASVDKK